MAVAAGVSSLGIGVSVELGVGMGVSLWVAVGAIVELGVIV